jgi:DNA polymerase I-like protein with 3'-5' exonuclease and polymerase domains
MRVAAHLSGDEAMIRELGPGGDIHSNTARTIYKTTEEEVGPKRWKEMRNLAKVVGFGSLYGLASCSQSLRLQVLYQELL